MSKMALMSFTALSIYANAWGNSKQNSQQMQQQNQQQQPPASVMTLTSARPESDNGWYAFVDALYWHADVGGTDWAFKNVSIDHSQSAGQTNRIFGPNHSLNFKWDWGFRAGLGMNMEHDQWDTNVYYTQFHTQNSNVAALSNNNQAIAGNFHALSPLFLKGTMKWKIHYSMFDWELGRWFHVSRNLSLRPHIGVKGGWINQKMKESGIVDFNPINHLFPDGYRVSAKSKFWGVGPSAGLNTNWMLGCVGSHHFDLFGDFAAALMYGHFAVNHHEVRFVIAPVTGANSEFSPSHLNRNLAVPMLQAIFGLSWDTGFNRNRNHVTFRAGYEFQYWWRQNQMITQPTFLGIAPANGVRYQRLSEDLALQGLTLDVRFDF